MNKSEILKIIFDEKIKVDNIQTENELTQWFWKVGFRNIDILEEEKHIICEVSRPNQFIYKFKKPIINFLIHLSEHIFPEYGYTFELKKFGNDEYYSLYKNYTETIRGTLK